MLNPTDVKPLSITTINCRFNSLRSYYSWVVKNKMLQHNQMVDIRNLKSAGEESERIVQLAEDEFEALLIMVKKKTS